ncbi:uncharacterized protein [Macrobrachium rosenbergii]|uniref:uncharacterized protein isoform X1 n=1 Tax=Macrobrachium rosenbergii TaxID=79674 RepID=UPI0034D3EACD
MATREVVIIKQSGEVDIILKNQKPTKKVTEERIVVSGKRCDVDITVKNQKPNKTVVMKRFSSKMSFVKLTSLPRSRNQRRMLLRRRLSLKRRLLARMKFQNSLAQW